MSYDCRVCQKTLRTTKGRHLHEKRVHGHVEGKPAVDPEGVPGEINPTETVAPGPPVTLEPEKPELPNTTEGLVEDPCAFVRLEAESRADSLGHDLGKWASAGKHTALAYCTDCGMDVAYALHPPPGGEKVVGRAVSEKCTN